MAPGERSVGLKYLTDAAHLLRSTAPETSAHLMSQRSELLFQQDMALPDSQRQHVCAACGSIMILGQGSELRMKPRRPFRREGKGKALDMKKTPAAAATGPAKVLSCGFCGRLTTTTLPPPAPVTRRRPTKARGEKRMDHAEAAKQATANASSKMRAKNRKTGLQALLAGQQQRQSRPLSLADFRRK